MLEDPGAYAIRQGFRSDTATSERYSTGHMRHGTEGKLSLSVASQTAGVAVSGP